MSFSCFNTVGGYQLPLPPPVQAKTFYGITSDSNSDSQNKSEYPLPPLMSTDTDSFTVEFFYKNNYNGTDYTYEVVYLYNSTTNKYVTVKIEPGNNRYYTSGAFAGTTIYPNNISVPTFRKSSLRTKDFLGTDTTVAARWHHVAIIYNGSTYSAANSTKATYLLYINGTQIPVVDSYPNNRNLTTHSTFHNDSVNTPPPNSININSTTTLRICRINNDTGLVNPIYNLRITKKAVYTGTFTVPSTAPIGDASILKKTQPAGTNIAAIGDNECIFCAESYKINDTNEVVIRDSVSGTNLNMTAVNLLNDTKICVFNSVEQIFSFP